MAGKSVGVDWYQGAYTVLEKIEDRLIPVQSFSEVYDCIRHVCKNYDHLDTVDVSEAISEIATLEARNETIKKLDHMY